MIDLIRQIVRVISKLPTLSSYRSIRIVLDLATLLLAIFILYVCKLRSYNRFDFHICLYFNLRMCLLKCIQYIRSNTNIANAR